MKIGEYGAGAYAAAARRLREPVGPAASGTPGQAAAPGGSFGALLQDQAASAADALRQGERTAMGGLLGKTGVQDVVEAVSAAELGLQKVTAVRDRVISAYQEIMRMPI
ncbi:MAG: flagellar hook-basal body complex protein FliE [Geminicoccaceae bacterium]